MPHLPGHRSTFGPDGKVIPGYRSRLDGLLAKGQGQGLFGPNIRQGGVALGPSRNTLIGPNPAATNAMGAAINRYAPRGLPTPASPRVMNTGGAKVSDIFKNAQMGQFGSRPAVGGIGGGGGGMSRQALGVQRIGQQIQQAQQVQQAPGVPDTNAWAAAARQRAAGQSGAGAQEPGLEETFGALGTGPGATPGGGPEDILAPSQSFFGRIFGDKGSGKRSDIGSAMVAAGGRMMQGSRDGTLATVGGGITAGADAYGKLKGQRFLREDVDRTRAQEDEDRAAQKRVNDKIAELTGGWDGTTTPEQKISDYQSAANVAFANSDSPLGRGLIEAARLDIADPEAGPSTSITNFDQIKYRAPDGTPARGRKRTVTQANGDLEQIFEYVDEDVLKENLDEGMGAADAQINSWRVGGYMSDPVEERRLEEEGEDEAGKRDMSGKMAFAARDANRSFVIDQDTGERVDLDFEMAGAVPIDWDEEGNAIDWKRGEVDDLRFWQSFFGDVISNAGSETVGIGKKLFNSIVRTKLPTELLQAYTEALNFINPTVRFLSGAQMTNQEAMRYYNALLPMTGDSVENIRKKRRKRDVLTAAMGGEGITDAEVRKAREFLGIDPDEEMDHRFSQFGREDETGDMAMNYYLAILEDKVGATNTFTSTQLREIQAGGGGAGGGAGSRTPVTPSSPLNFNYGALDSIPSAPDSIRGR